jgi:hypothetical protein
MKSMERRDAETQRKATNDMGFLCDSAPLRLNKGLLK